MDEWTSGRVVREPDSRVEHRWFELSSQVIVVMLAHSPPRGKWLPCDNNREVKGGKERNWPSYHNMPTAKDKYPL